MKSCPPLQQLARNTAHLDQCETCRALLMLREPARPDPAACDAIIALLPLLHRDVLTVAHQDEVISHLSQCPACLRSTLDEDSTPQESAPAVGIRRQPPRSTLPLAVTLAVAVAIAAAAVLMPSWSLDSEPLAPFTNGSERVAGGPARVDAADVPVTPAVPIAAEARAPLDGGRQQQVLSHGRGPGAPKVRSERPTSEEIAEGMRKIKPHLHGCRTQPSRGRVAIGVKLRIRPNGDVASVAATGGPEKLRRCVEGVLRRAKFAASDKGISLTYRVVLASTTADTAATPSRPSAP